MPVGPPEPAVELSSQPRSDPAATDSRRAHEPVSPPAAGSSRLSPLNAAESHSTLESRIGSHWLNRIGILAVLIGVSYFLKFAFENNWIGATGRVAIGLIAGIAVVLWSERFRAKGYRIFSFSLKAVGIGVLYLSLWASFQIYHLLPSEAVFGCMLLVTAATCTMALTQDAEILAVFAISGGFATPGLLSTGQNREIALFCYVVLLDLGILALIAFKPWRRLLWMGFGGTLAYYLLWYFSFYNRSQFELTLIFATVFFAIYAAAPLLMLRQEKGAGMMPLALAFVNAVAYFLQAYAMISEISTTASWPFA